MICLFGGTFDPTHLGHTAAAAAVCDTLELPQIQIVLSARPSHRGRTGVSMWHRWAMLKLACEFDERLCPSDLEVRRFRPSYTIDTLLGLRQQASTTSQSLALVVGTDVFNELDTWYRWQEIIELANIVVLHRQGEQQRGEQQKGEQQKGEEHSPKHDLQSLVEQRKISPQDMQRKLHDEGGDTRITFVDCDLPEVSGTQVRTNIANQQDIRNLVCEPVADYIHQHKLYGG